MPRPISVAANSEFFLMLDLTIGFEFSLHKILQNPVDRDLPTSHYPCPVGGVPRGPTIEADTLC